MTNKQSSFQRVGLATATPSGTGITIPRSGTGGGGEYGEDITDELRTFALTREPVAYRVVFTISKNIFDNWFTLEGSNYRTPTTQPSASAAEQTKTNEAYNRRVQKLLDKVNAKQELTRMAIYERGYGWAIIVLGYEDDAATLAEPASNIKGIQEIKAYGPTQISQVDEDKDPNSVRYGLPTYYHIMRTGELGTLKVHYTRCIHFATRLIDHDWKGKSTLDAIWDDLTTLRNIRWGMGQTMYRYGSGFPDITFTGAESQDIENWISSGAFSELSARTYFAHNEDQLLEFKGLEGHALNPMNYYLPPMEHISCGSGIPLAIIRGVQAGALTGSETDTANLWSMISSEQSAYEPGIRQLINALTGQESDYTFNWKGGFELDEQKKQQIALTRAQELDILWSFYKRNEIRKMIDPDASELSAEEGGDDLKGKSNGPQPEIKINPLTGQPIEPSPFGNKPTLEDEKVKEQIEKGDASYLITEISHPRKPHTVSS
jgi:hypothetical protein